MTTSYKLATKGTEILVKEGRKIAGRIPTTLTAAALAGILDGANTEDLALDDILQLLEAAVANAMARKGSVIPNGYREQYGVDQSCGDEVAKALTAKVTTEHGVDLDACREVAAANGVEDRFDVWLDRQLNPGMVRMNLGNVLRGKARRGEEVLGL